MALELRNVTKRVGAEVHIHETNLVLEEGSFNTLLGPTLAGKTTLMQLMAGLDRPTSGEIWFRGKNVTGVPVQKRNVADGLPAVHQLPELHRLREHRLAAAGRRRRRSARSRRGSCEAAELLRLTPMLTAPAERAFRRPAAAHRDRPRAGQGLRPHPARRAARQSRLQAARGAARRAAAVLRRPQLHRRLRHDRADRGAAVRRQHRDAARRPGHPVRPDRRDLPPAGRPGQRPGVLRSADQHRGGRASAATRS